MTTVALTEAFFNGAISFDGDDDWIQPWRIPVEQLPLFPEVYVQASNAAGMRLRFQSDATQFTLSCLGQEGTQSFALIREDGLRVDVNGEVGCESYDFDMSTAEGYNSENGRIYAYDLWLHHAQPCQLRSITHNGRLLEAIPDTRPRWSHYGSSISHCKEALNPADTWPAHVARALDLNLTCFGVGGQCHLEPMMVKNIAQHPADIITAKIGINVNGRRSLNDRTFVPAILGLVERIRSEQPSVPIGLISPIFSYDRETASGEKWLSLVQMRELIQEAVERLSDTGYENVFYFDGLTLFNNEEADAMMPDNLHPNNEGYARLAENFLTRVAPHLPVMSQRLREG